MRDGIITCVVTTSRPMNGWRTEILSDAIGIQKSLLHVNGSLLGKLSLSKRLLFAMTVGFATTKALRPKSTLAHLMRNLEAYTLVEPHGFSPSSAGSIRHFARIGIHDSQVMNRIQHSAKDTGAAVGSFPLGSCLSSSLTHTDQALPPSRTAA